MADYVSEAEFDAAIGRAFGQAGANPAVRGALRDAGFDDEQADRGVTLWESGRFFDFEDLALFLSRGGTLGSGLDRNNRRIAPKVTPASIAEAARRLPPALGGTGVQEQS